MSIWVIEWRVTSLGPESKQRPGEDIHWRYELERSAVTSGDSTLRGANTGAHEAECERAKAGRAPSLTTSVAIRHRSDAAGPISFGIVEYVPVETAKRTKGGDAT